MRLNPILGFFRDTIPSLESAIIFQGGKMSQIHSFKCTYSTGRAKPLKAHNELSNPIQLSVIHSFILLFLYLFSHVLCLGLGKDIQFLFSRSPQLSDGDIIIIPHIYRWDIIEAQRGLTVSPQLMARDLNQGSLAACYILNHMLWHTSSRLDRHVWRMR